MLAASILVFLIMLEIALRLAGIGPQKYPKIFMKSQNQKLIYELMPNGSIIMDGINITINSKGMRDYEYGYKKNKDTVRIAVIGDSVTAAFQVELDDSYPKALERKLNSKNKNGNYEVLNFGINGYGIEQETELLKAKAIQFDPDILVIGYILNDPEPSPGLIGQFKTLEDRKGNRCMVYSLELAIPCGLKDFIDGLSITEFVYSKIINIRSRFNDDVYTAFHKANSSWGNVASSFKEIRLIAGKNDIDVIIVIFPLFYEEFENYKWEWIHEKVKEEAEINGFYAIDLLEPYKEQGLQKLKIKRNDVVHPNVLGHEIAAQYIYDATKNITNSQNEKPKQ
ncbi:SGNH/GDSL hydrolase family protein [Candidatus Woesearchaeota archaeon]|nr:SGNH/GDSL hydrolase family protein [Candidatus Woesearchaeota archaeon]